MLRTKPVVLAMLIGVLATACGGSSSGGGGGSGSNKIAGIAANIHGTKDVSAGGTVELEADNYYFSPSVLKGKPGEKVTIHVANDSSTEHNFTIDAQNINKDLSSGGDVTVTATFPQSGVLSFFCEYHKSQGMAGGLLVSGSASG
ncbi:MAG: Cupredoxin-like domain [Frankiaceae bacterium]|jgi:plastocyanin|nr:Cupredoxin-like domain [Frankiaceae bacterium]